MKTRNVITLIYVLALPIIVLSLFVGPTQSAGLGAWMDALWGRGTNTDLVFTVIYQIRLPRVLLTFLVGGALAVSGCSIQAVFRNPLTDPYILGLSSGAAFGAALALATAWLPVQLSAFVFGLTAVGMSFFMARKNNTVAIVSLILSGIIVSGIFTSLLAIVQYFSDPFRLQSIVHWTMGNLHLASATKLKMAVFPLLLGSATIFVYRWRMNLIALGDDEAQSSGIHPGRDKAILLIAATLASSSAVAVAGIIGLYGLIVPHIVRMFSGPDNRQAVPLNFVFGGTFLLLIDDLSRSFAGLEIPIGVFTMLLGGPVFIYLMKKNNIGWND